MPRKGGHAEGGPPGQRPKVGLSSPQQRSGQRASRSSASAAEEEGDPARRPRRADGRFSRCRGRCRRRSRRARSRRAGSVGPRRSAACEPCQRRGGDLPRGRRRGRGIPLEAARQAYERNRSLADQGHRRAAGGRSVTRPVPERRGGDPRRSRPLGGRWLSERFGQAQRDQSDLGRGQQRPGRSGRVRRPGRRGGGSRAILLVSRWSSTHRLPLRPMCVPVRQCA